MANIMLKVFFSSTNLLSKGYDNEKTTGRCKAEH